MGSDLLTTGEVAGLCGVTADAVLKWIKKGRLPATRTPGGHYRVSRADCVALGIVVPVEVETATDLSGLDADAVGNPGGRPGESHATPVTCWEFFSSNGTPREVCRTCLVYAARAQNCYRLAEFGGQVGHRRAFCATNDCEDCPYYRAGHGLTTSVLVVTTDEVLELRLAGEVDAGRVTLRFAHSGYEASTAVGDMCPAVIILDSSLAEVRDGALPEMIRRDERAPGVRIVVACREGDEQAIADLGLPYVPAAITAQQLEKLAEVVPVSYGSRATTSAG